MGNTVVIGTVYVDLKGFASRKYDPYGRNVGDVKIFHGGVGRNVVENFANVGMPVSFVSMLEDSAFGRDVERHLTISGADLTHMIKAPKNGIGMWMVILDEHGDQAGSISRLPDMTCLEAHLKANGDRIISEADAVVLEVDLNEDIAEHVVKLAKKYGKPIYAIVSSLIVAKPRKDLIRQMDCFICNDIEAGKFFDHPLSYFTVEEMIRYLPQAVRQEGLRSMVVTMGARGAVYYDGETNEAGFCPPCPTNVVDTSGAGDAFFSGTVMALIRGKQLCDAVGYGARLASMTISREETSCPVDREFFEREI